MLLGLHQDNDFLTSEIFLVLESWMKKLVCWEAKISSTSCSSHRQLLRPQSLQFLQIWTLFFWDMMSSRWEPLNILVSYILTLVFGLGLLILEIYSSWTKMKMWPAWRYLIYLFRVSELKLTLIQQEGTNFRNMGRNVLFVRIQQEQFTSTYYNNPVGYDIWKY